MKIIFVFIIFSFSFLFANDNLQKCTEIIPHQGMIALGQECCMNGGYKECVKRDYSQDEDIVARRENLNTKFEAVKLYDINMSKIEHKSIVNYYDHESLINHRSVLMIDILPLDIVELKSYFPLQNKLGLSTLRDNILMNYKMNLFFLYNGEEDKTNNSEYKFDSNVDRCRGPDGRFAKNYMCDDQNDEMSFSMNADMNYVHYIDSENIVFSGIGVAAIDPWNFKIVPYINIGMRYIPLPIDFGFLFGGEVKYGKNYFSLSLTTGFTINK